jgi:hypothetical protein
MMTTRSVADPWLSAIGFSYLRSKEAASLAYQSHSRSKDRMRMLGGPCLRQ